MDVIVIGCGAAGIAALRKLHEAGLKVLGLEAGDRIGGRICTVPYGDRYLDLGAAWCHGEKDNVVFEIANPLNLLSRSESDKKYFVLSNGTLLPQETGEEFVKALNDELTAADKSAGSISGCVRNAAKTNQILKKDPALAQLFIEWFEHENHVGGQDDPKKGKSLKGLEEFHSCEGDFLLNWKGRGFRTILDVLLNKYPDASKELPVEIHLKKEVESIKWGTTKPGLDSGNPLVQIKCKDGSLFAAKSVIITVSLGVLKERHNQLFNPPLPIEKVNAINNLQLCVLDKIYIEFTKPWWPKQALSLNILWKKEDKAKFSVEEQWVTEVSGFLTVEHHPNLLLGWIYGEGAKKMEKISEEQVKATIIKMLEIFFNKFPMAPVKSILRTQWASNPLTRGSYSYRSVATEEKGGSSAILSEPLYHGNDFPVACFAGEATSYHHYSGVHGAVESGFREAERLISCFKK
ncbi:spermine oxidase-like [Melitaea cinxia]|uniref:spermine oxidase-like n=1 Tax=Melitaea cinxia TaxID=113334 RepID=UPI001E270B42|nr:spermine oxidase-like [Melitaea cinxia]